MQEKLARQEQELALVRDSAQGKTDVTAESTEVQHQQTDIEMSRHEVSNEMETVFGGSTLRERDPTKEPSSSTDVRPVIQKL